MVRFFRLSRECRHWRVCTRMHSFRARTAACYAFRVRNSTDLLDAPMTGSSRLGNSSSRARFDYLLVESTEIAEPLPAAEPLLGRRTTLTFPLLPPPQKN